MQTIWLDIHTQSQKLKKQPRKNSFQNIFEKIKTQKFQLTRWINKEHKVRSPRASQENRKNMDIDLQKMKAETTIPSIGKLSAASSSSIGIVHRYLRRELKLFPYKVTIGQSLSDNHKANRYDFCKRMMSKISKDTTFLSYIVWSDECLFQLNGWVNRKNIRFWEREKSHDVVEYTAFTPRVNVWIGILSSFLIGPYFFDHNGKSETINSERYFDMLVHYVLPKLK